MADLHDLAKHLNVSISTVSRALAGKQHVNEQTRARVVAAAQSLGYAPNRSGRALRAGATHNVVFVLSPHPQLQYFEPFFMTLLAGVQEALAARGLELVVVLGRAGDGQLEQLRQIVETRSADAVLLAWTRRSDERIRYLIDTGFPFATLGRSQTGTAFPSLDIDFDDIGFAAAERLLDLGHRRIALVNAPHALNFSRYLLAGYQRALTQRGVGLAEELVCEDQMTEAGGHAIARALMAQKDPPSAVILPGDLVVAGAYRAFSELSMRPGRDVSVIAIADSPLCHYLQPALTCFRPRLHDFGVRLAEILLAAMPGFSGPDGAQVIRETRAVDLVVRDSDGPFRPV